MAALIHPRNVVREALHPRHFFRKVRDAVYVDWLAYGFALAAPWFIFWLHLALGLTAVLHVQVRNLRTEGDLRGFLLFLVPVILSAYVGGAGPGILSTFVSAGVMDRFLLPHASGLYLPSRLDGWRLIAFVAAGSLLSLVIDKQHRRKQQSRASRRLVDVTLANICDAVITTDGLGKVTFLNAEAERLTGWENDRAVGRLLSEIYETIDDETGKPSENPLEEVASAGAPARLNARTLIARGGREQTPIGESVSQIAHPEGRLEGFVVVFRDVSESRKAEAELRKRLELQEQITRIVNTAPAIMYSFRRGLDGTICFPFSSPAIEDLVSVSPAELRKDAAVVFSRVHPDDLAHLSGTIDESEKKLSTWQCEYRVYGTNGDEIWMEGRAVPQREADGSTLWYGFMDDITERKHVQQQLQLLTTALESAANAVVLTDASGNMIWTNAAFTTMTGYTAEEARGKNPRILSSGNHPRDFYKAMWETLRAGHIWRGEVVNRRKDATLYTEEMTITPVFDDRGGITHFIAIKQDVTQERALERRLSQSQKMEAIGQLAGGIAHDFNNILAVILGNIEILTEQVVYSAPQRIMIEQARQAANHAASLTAQLLAFSRQQVVQAVILDLNATISKLEGMLRRVIREDIVIVTSLSPQSVSVKADPLQIEQILMNLAVNARDAMTGGGTLRIETRNVTVGDETAKANLGMASGDYALLAVSDTGTGMDTEIQAHIFEPFFTTKDMGQGTGLGLATVYGIIKQIGGYVEVDSTPGRGSTFKIYLPRVEEGPAQSVIEESKSVHGGVETILVVEDSAPLLELLCSFLETGNYTVLQANNPHDAIRIGEEHGNTISLLVTDIVMPAMSGRDLAAEMVTLSPAIKILYISGYAADAFIQGKGIGLGESFLQKPFTRKAFMSRVREALDS